MGGSGGSAAQTFPTYLQCVHSQALYGFDLTGQQGLYAKNPQPGSYFNLMYDAMGATFSTTNGIVDSLDMAHANPYSTDFDLAAVPSGSMFHNVSIATAKHLDLTNTNTALSNANSYADTIAAADWIDTEVSDYEDAMLPQFARSVNRLTSAFAGINGLNSSAFHISMALLESGRYQAAAMHRSEALTKQRDQLASLRMGLVELNMSVEKTRYVADVDEFEQQIDINKAVLEWPLELYRYTGNLISSVSGGTSSGAPVKNRTASAMAGALGGAALGYGMAGAKVAGVTLTAPWTMGIGALLGIGAGLLSS